MANRETAVQNQIWLDVGALPGTRLFRNNNGAYKNDQGQLVKYGLGTGTSDLIGFQVITVTPEMVGRKIAVFAALEIKPSPKEKPTPAQAQFIQQVNASGGLAGVAHSTETAKQILRLD